MKTEKDNEYASRSRIVWGIYVLAAILLIIFLVAVVAQDNEEKLFYSLMTVAAAYVFRPTERIIGKAVTRLFGVTPPDNSDDSA